MTHETIASAGLISHERKLIHSVGSARLHQFFFINLVIFGSYDDESANTSAFALDERIEIADMEDNRNFQILLGMDVLRRFDFCFYKSSRVELNLR